MTDTTGALPPAGWYPDPYGAPFERWWDGTGWTTHTNTPEAAVAPTPAVPEYTPPVQADPFANFATPSQQTTEPAFEQPAYQAPVTEQPAYQAPAFEQPVFEQPVFEQPVFEQPVFEQPVFEQPAYQPQSFEQPAYQPPVTEQPAYQPPVTEQPVYQPPVTEQPVYQAPVFEQPAFEQPVFEQPAYQPPVTQQPAYEAPITQQPAFEQPAANPYPENFYRPGEPEQAPARVAYDDQPYTQAPATTPPAAQQAVQAGMPNPPSSFDFGLGPARTGDTGMPSNVSIPADSESGLFGSWEPNEYTVPPSNRPANAGLVFGILSFFFSAVAGIVGLILSAIGLGRSSQFAREGAGPVGRGKAIAGIALSLVGSVVSAGAIYYASQTFLANLNEATDPGTGQVTDDGTVVTANGGIPLAVGETGTIPMPGTETPAISFTVTSITPAFVCTAPEEEVVSPDNGQFIAVKMDLTLSGDYLSAMDGGLPLIMSQSDWRGHSTDPNAAAVENTDAGLTCVPETELFPGELSAGTTTSATVILDMALDTVSVSWAPSGVTDLDAGLTRWEWPVGAA